MKTPKEIPKEMKKEFVEAWDRYWYEIKPVWSRLHDDQTEEFIVCAKFFCALKKLA